MSLYDEFHESWHPVVKVYEKHLLRALKAKGTIYPPRELIFRVFSMDVEKIKVVILGQDPYHGPNQATGLAFSCNDGKSLQPSLRNIFKEINDEFPERKYDFKTGDLGRWNDEENIFLLNTALSVKASEPGSLLDEWREFTVAVIDYIDRYNPNCVFLLMGRPAQLKAQYIEKKDRIITCVHPSPLSASKGFFGSGVFKAIEDIVGPINWQT